MSAESVTSSILSITVFILAFTFCIVVAFFASLFLLLIIKLRKIKVRKCAFGLIHVFIFGGGILLFVLFVFPELSPHSRSSQFHLKATDEFSKKNYKSACFDFKVLGRPTVFLDRGLGQNRKLK
jgi:hypothetical protein